jgi:hypothetical protein
VQAFPEFSSPAHHHLNRVCPSDSLSLARSFDDLCQFFGFSNELDGNFLNNMTPLVASWARVLHDTVQAKTQAIILNRPGRLVPINIVLPEPDFHQIHRQFSASECPKCQTVPTYPALCLLCGELLCAFSACCQLRKCGECTQVSIKSKFMRGCFNIISAFTITACTVVWKRGWSYVDAFQRQNHGTDQRSRV